MIYADTSFLFSLVLHDAKTAAVIAYLRVNPVSLALTPFQQCELRNAVRLSAFRAKCTPSEAQAALARIDADLASGNLHEVTLSWPDVFAKAEALSAAHALSLGVRSLDLLHVAAALTIEAEVFLTCDARQLDLARAAGLTAILV